VTANEKRMIEFSDDVKLTYCGRSDDYGTKKLRRGGADIMLNENMCHRDIVEKCCSIGNTDRCGNCYCVILV
jgi:hypothetical protein